MQNENTTATAPMTADSLKAAYDALPHQLRPFYAYLHTATTALLNAIPEFFSLERPKSF